MKNIIIIGAGASGILCAIEASKNNNNHIILIEKNETIGKKLSLTGNGKCNYTNLDFNENKLDDYYNNKIVCQIFNRFNNLDLINYFESLGILSYEFKKDNFKYIYPLTNKSKDVINVFKNYLNKKNIEIKLEEEVIDINFENDFKIKTNNNYFHSDYLVLATGGISYIKNFKNLELHYFNKIFNFNLIKPLPGLCPVNSDDFLLNNINSFRCFCKIDLYVDNKFIKKQIGEVQFNDKSLSGIPIFQISSIVSRMLDSKKTVEISFDFLYSSYNNKIKTNILYQLLNYSYNKSIYEFFLGIIPKEIINKFIEILKIDKYVLIKNIDDAKIKKIINLLTNYKIKISSTSNFEKSQITLGGIDVNEINISNFMSKKIKNLFLIGEMLDIDGICGGYNLQYAFTSGYICGNYLKNDTN